MWQRLELPGLEDPIRGFTFPKREVLFVLTPGGLVRVALDSVEARRVTDAEAVAALDKSHGGSLVWEGERHLVFDAGRGRHSAHHRPGRADGAATAPEHRLSAAGSWLWAGFSDDGRWLVACEPGGVQVFHRNPDTLVCMALSAHRD